MPRIQNKQIEVSENFDINSQNLINVNDPIDDQDAATKIYVDSQISTTGGVIGAAEDTAGYVDGLFTDFNPLTPTGTAIDRFNEILKALAPGPAPLLDQWTGALSATAGKLSFGTGYTIGGYALADVSQGGYNPGIGVNGIAMGFGIIAEAATNDITGVLNDDVVADGVNYPANSFGNATEGTIRLYVNGTLVSTVTLSSTTAAIDNTSGNTVSGFILSAADDAHFPDLTPLDVFKHRTGTWLVKYDDTNIQRGYNWVHAIRTLNAVDTTLARFQFIVDHDTTITTFTAPVLDTLAMTGSKYLSGVQYYTGGTAKYQITINNAYLNTYSSSGSAISHPGASNCAIPSVSIPAIGSHASLVDYTSSIQYTASQLGLKTATITSGIRLLDESITVNTRVLRTLQGTQTSSSSSIANILMDDVGTASSLVFEDFNHAETYRMPSNSSYNTYGSLGTGMWTSTNTIADAGSAGYNDGLQVIGSELVYPGNTAYPANFAGITNGPGGNPDYSGANCTGTRYYYRWFRQVAPTVGNFVLNIAGSTGTFVSDLTALTGNNIHVHIKAPGLAAAETGWMDAYQDFATGQWADGDGARNAAGGVGRAFGTAWGLTIGTKSTANTNGYILVRVSVGDSFAGILTGITFSFG